MRGWSLGFLPILWLTAQAQPFPSYLQRQIQAGTLTLSEAKLIYHQPRPSNLPQKSNPVSKVTVSTPQPTLFKITMIDLQTAALRHVVLGTAYLLPDTPAINTVLQRQKNLVLSLRRTGGRRPIGIGTVPNGTFSEPPTAKNAAMLGQLSQFETFAVAHAFTQALLDEKTFTLKTTKVKQGLLLVVIRSGPRIAGIWTTPTVADQPITLGPSDAFYWVP